jgi:hypothetical protein
VPVSEEVCGFSVWVKRSVGERYQNVRWLEIFVQYSRIVRISNCRGDSHEKLQTLLQRHRADAFGPAAVEVGTCVLALDEVRRILEVPFQQAHEIRAVAESFVQEPGYGDFPLQAS